MAEKPMRILQVSTIDNYGGAARIAWSLHRAYLERGLHAWMAVGQKFSDDPNILFVPNDLCRSHWERIWLFAGNMLLPFVGRIKGAGMLRRWIHWIGQLQRWCENQCGHEDFRFPGTWKLLDLPAERVEIIHCHNLHGGYFDLRALPWLSHQAPVVLTLHDAWLLSGHCAHSFDCDKWKTDCRNCPDLSIYPAIKHNATFFNWHRKKNIYAKSRLYVATPSKWLMDKVEESILAPSIIESKVIPNGIDLEIFHPAEKQTVRDALRIPQDAKVLLFTANGIRKNIWKDYQMLRRAVSILAERLNDQELLFIALGEDGPAEQIGKAEVRFVPYQKDSQVVARYYQAADVYVYAARADTFPNTVLEALACGMPVVATAVGGIPEQINSLRFEDLDGYEMNGANGVLVPNGDAERMAAVVVRLLTEDTLRFQLGKNAAKDASKRYDLKQQADKYLEWYCEIVEDWKLNQYKEHA